VVYAARNITSYDRSVAEGRTHEDSLVRTQMVEQIAQNETGHFINRAPFLGIIVSAARIPATRSFNMNLSSNVAISQYAPERDGDRIRIVVNAPEVSGHLCTFATP